MSAAFGVQAQRFDRQRLRAMFHSVDRTHKLSAQDRDYAVAATKVPDFRTWNQAFLVLEAAAKGGQFPVDRFIELSAKKSIETTDPYPPLCARNVISVLSLPLPSKKYEELATFTYVPRGKRPASLRVLSQIEKEAVSKSLSSRRVGDRTVAGRVLVVKSGLAPDALAWATKRISNQLSRSSGSEKAYWQFVQRVVDGRNLRAR